MKTVSPINTQTAGYLVIFGIFAVLLGVIGYQTHLEDAVPALIFRGSFGALLIGCGILVAKGVRLSRLAALLTVTLGAQCACVPRGPHARANVAKNNSTRSASLRTEVTGRAHSKGRPTAREYVGRGHERGVRKGRTDVHDSRLIPHWHLRLSHP